MPEPAASVNREPVAWSEVRSSRHEHPSYDSFVQANLVSLLIDIFAA